MTVGAGIFLAALGAILRYAVADQVDGVDLRAIGVILMIAGVVGIVIGLIQTATARRHVVTEYHDAPPSRW